MRIHLVTYATPRFRHRQIILGWSGRLNRIVDTVTSWTPEKLRNAGFEDCCKDVKLSERGSGYWAWKPFIIDAKLREVPDGDLVYYGDVGRRYPFKQYTESIAPFVEWMKLHDQPMMPGVLIPWNGPMSMWTKRDAFVTTEMDRPEVHSSSPTQASFSFWIANDATRAFVREWMNLASQRPLISDDPSVCGLPELPDFRDHRHDQSLLSLCCLKHNIKGLDIGSKMPPINTQHSSEVASWINGDSRGRSFTIAGRILYGIAWPLAHIEQMLRRLFSFGEPATHHTGNPVTTAPHPLKKTATQRSHPYDPNISNGRLAVWLIFLTRHRIPVISRLYITYLNCDLWISLPGSVFLPHPLGIVVASGVKFGEDVVIGHQVTIGNRSGLMASPTIGNRVYIGAGAKILGPITIGDDVIIGANAVVTKDVPPGTVVTGANIHRKNKNAYWQPGHHIR